MSTAFDNLLNLSKSFEPDEGEKCNEFGNNIYQPIDGGISDFNKGVVTMSPYGNYNIALTEAVEYEYDAKLLFDHLKPLEEFFKQQLKEKNKEEINIHKSYPADKNYGSAIGFMQGIDGDMTDEEKESVKSLKYIDHESKFPPVLSSNIDFDSKYSFLSTLKNIYSDLPADVVNSIVANASGFISEFNINSYRDFINKVKSEIANRNYTHIAREKPEFK